MSPTSMSLIYDPVCAGRPLQTWTEVNDQGAGPAARRAAGGGRQLGRPARSPWSNARRLGLRGALRSRRAAPGPQRTWTRPPLLYGRTPPYSYCNSRKKEVVSRTILPESPDAGNITNLACFPRLLLTTREKKKVCSDILRFAVIWGI